VRAAKKRLVAACAVAASLGGGAVLAACATAGGDDSLAPSDGSTDTTTGSDGGREAGRDTSSHAEAAAEAGMDAAIDMGPACDDGGTSCEGGCVDTTGDPNNCGGCGVVCMNGEACNASLCTCSGASCNGCCAGDAGCLGGDSGTACGTNGMACVACGDSGTCNGGVCGECAPGSIDSVACGGMCASQSRTCDNTGHWGPYGACQGSGVCDAGEVLPCQCGVRWLCDNKCLWNLDLASMNCATCKKPVACLDAGGQTDLGLVECFNFGTCCSGGSAGTFCSSTCN
jgi:hypothetical protein